MDPGAALLYRHAMHFYSGVDTVLCNVFGVKYEFFGVKYEFF